MQLGNDQEDMLNFGDVPISKTVESWVMLSNATPVIHYTIDNDYMKRLMISIY